MSFGREALRKTLKRLKENVLMDIESVREFNKFFIEKNKEMMVELTQVSEDFKKASDERERLEAISEFKEIQVSQLERKLILEEEKSRKQSEFINSLFLYVSALENYALEFDKTWDNLMEEMKKQEEKIEETTKELKKKTNLSYIK